MEPYEVILDDELVGEEILNLERNITSKVVGQNNAVTCLLQLYQNYQSGMTTPGKPLGSFLFLGPTGSGKTRLVEALAESLYPAASIRESLVKIDCGEFQHSHEIAKLIGSPPGYLGHRETHPLLSQKVLQRHWQPEGLKISFLLFDEIEKASDSLWKLLLGIMDKSILTLGNNETVNFDQTAIFLTSNLGAADMNALLQDKMGFKVDRKTIEERVDVSKPDAAKIEKIGLSALKKAFGPEFINRIDNVCVFHYLSQDDLAKILEIELQNIQNRIKNNISFIVDKETKAFLLSKGTSLLYGARYLKRTLEKYLVGKLANILASRQIRMNEILCLTFPEGSEKIQFSVMRSAEDQAEMETQESLLDYIADENMKKLYTAFKEITFEDTDDDITRFKAFMASRNVIPISKPKRKYTKKQRLAS